MDDPSLAWMAAGFAVAWIVLGAYFVRLWLAQRTIDRRVDELTRRMERRGELG